MKFFKHFFVALSFLFFSFNVNALTEEEKIVNTELSNYINAISTSTKNTNIKLKNYLDTYQDDLNILDVSFVKTITNYLNDDDYESTLNSIISKLDEKGKTDAARDLENIKSDILKEIDDLEDLDQRLRDYRNTYYYFGITDMTPVRNALTNFYTDNVGMLKQIASILTNKVNEYINNNYDKYSNLTIEETYNKLDNYYNDLSLIDSLYIKYQDKITDEKNFINNNDLAGIDYENTISEDFKEYYESMKDNLDNKYNDYVNNRWIVLEDFISNILNSNNTNKEKNTLLTNKINYINDIKDKVTNKYNHFISITSINKISNDLTKSYNKVNNKLNDAIIELQNNLLVEDYELIIKKGSTDNNNFRIDYTNKVLISSNIYTTDSILNDLGLKDNNGNIIFDGDINGRLGTNSKVIVTDGTNPLKTYVMIVKGDLNGDAEIGIIDYVRIMKDIMDTTKLSGIYFTAGDMNDNNKIDIIDYIRVMKYIMEEK